MRAGDLVQITEILRGNENCSWRLYADVENPPFSSCGKFAANEIAIVIEVEKKQTKLQRPWYAKILTSSGDIGWIQLSSIDLI